MKFYAMLRNLVVLRGEGLQWLAFEKLWWIVVFLTWVSWVPVLLGLIDSRKNAWIVVIALLHGKICILAPKLLLFPQISRIIYNSILIEVSADPVLYERRRRHFHFEEMWLQHRDCPALIEQGWALTSLGEPMKQVWMKINSTGKLLREWHLGVFQQRQVELKLVQDKLDTLMRLPYAADQFEVQQALHCRFNELLFQDETYWRQRSRVLWLKDGDRNSAFFHRRASNRKSRNKVKELNNAAGNWQTNPKLVSKILVQYYEGIFKENCDVNAFYDF